MVGQQRSKSPTPLSIKIFGRQALGGETMFNCEMPIIAIMRHIREKYEAIMKQISLIFSKNEVLGAAIFVYCQAIKKL